MIKFLRTIFAVVMILLFFTPIPGSTIFLAIGLSLLVCTSLPFALLVHRLRKRFTMFNGGLQWVEQKLGKRWASGMMTTRPDANPRDHFANKNKGCPTIRLSFNHCIGKDIEPVVMLDGA